MENQSYFVFFLKWVTLGFVLGVAFGQTIQLSLNTPTTPTTTTTTVKPVDRLVDVDLKIYFGWKDWAAGAGKDEKKNYDIIADFSHILSHGDYRDWYIQQFELQWYIFYENGTKDKIINTTRKAFWAKQDYLCDGYTKKKYQLGLGNNPYGKEKGDSNISTLTIYEFDKDVDNRKYELCFEVDFLNVKGPDIMLCQTYDLDTRPKTDYPMLWFEGPSGDVFYLLRKEKTQKVFCGATVPLVSGLTPMPPQTSSSPKHNYTLTWTKIGKSTTQTICETEDGQVYCAYTLDALTADNHNDTFICEGKSNINANDNYYNSTQIAIAVPLLTVNFPKFLVNNVPTMTVLRNETVTVTCNTMASRPDAPLIFMAKKTPASVLRLIEEDEDDWPGIRIETFKKTKETKYGIGTSIFMTINTTLLYTSGIAATNSTNATLPTAINDYDGMYILCTTDYQRAPYHGIQKDVSDHRILEIVNTSITTEQTTEQTTTAATPTATAATTDSGAPAPTAKQKDVPKIIGGVVGGILVLILIAVGIVFYLKMQNNKKVGDDDENDYGLGENNEEPQTGED